MIRVLILFFAAYSWQAFSQQWPFEYWHEGKLVLEEGDTLKGKIKYDINTDIIQLDQKNVFQSFTARKIVFFEIFDVTSSRYRQFYSIPFSQMGGYKTPTFFELLTEGKLTLLAKEALEYKNYSSGYYGYGSISRLVLVNKYFVLNDKGEIEMFSGIKKDLMELMSNRNDEVKKFIKVNKLNLDYKYDLARVFVYYNSLFGKK
jgi:hypothetical protein